MSSFPNLNLPTIDAQIRRDSDSARGGMEIYDPLRRQWVALSPEEWVRQHFTAFLINTMKFPAGLMANEVGLKLNNTLRRMDTIIYDKNLKPWMIVEYKAPSVVLTQAVFDQIARYNSVIKAPYLVVSNGLKHFCCIYDNNGYSFLHALPAYPENSNP